MMHQHLQDLSPYPWYTPEQFRATVAWPSDKPIFQEEAGPAYAQGAAQGDGGRTEDDEDMADLVDYFIAGD